MRLRAARAEGFWDAGSPDIGDLNNIAVLRGFADDAELLRERDRTLRSSNPFGCGDLMTSLKLEAYAPFPNLPPVEPGSFGPVYEIRSYILKTGGLSPTFEGWAEKLAARTELSRLTWRSTASMVGRASRTSGPMPVSTSAAACGPRRSNGGLGRRRARSGSRQRWRRRSICRPLCRP